MTELPKLALGAWAWGDSANYFGNDYDESHFKDVFKTSIENGLNLWDTAYAYGSGASETILGDLMKDTPREDLLISTKFTPMMADPSNDQAVNEMFEGSLQRLRTNYVDYYWIHNDNDVELWTPKIIPLVQSGQVKHVGVSNHDLHEIKRVVEILDDAGIKLSAVQNHYSLLDRTSENAGILDYCKENNIKFFSYMVLEQGALTGKYDEDHPFPKGSQRAIKYNDKLQELSGLNHILAEIGAKHNVSAAQVAMAWAVAKGTFPIVGVTKVEQVKDAANVVNLKLNSDEIKALEDTAGKSGISTIREWEKDMRN
ncbi:aldo/keto reductase [Companilactobacillus musae]|uniref:aldo/keto reductase n=1 Tax=Companilactobacillus musae TaxID=1903258 RepID=UPI000E65D64F|nr:aldo/keto reductase [Companilactobacillus musae]